MPVPTPNISRAEKKAAALASARRWQEERKSPLAKIMSISPDENRVKIKGTPRRLDKEKALARARERDYEQRKTSPKSIPEAVETRHNTIIKNWPCSKIVPPNCQYPSSTNYASVIFNERTKYESKIQDSQTRLTRSQMEADRLLTPVGNCFKHIFDLPQLIPCHRFIFIFCIFIQ